jgi:LysM repeat protein
MRPRLPLLSLAAFAALVFAGGCDPSSSRSLSVEADNSDFKQGMELKREGNKPEALASFLKAIDDLGNDAPESHLEAGLLLEEDVKDHLEAIHYFRKYLEIYPKAPQADQVRQQIAAAELEFARTLPGHPVENQPGDQADAIARLTADNQRLRDQLAGLGVKPVASIPAPAFDSPIQAAPPAPPPSRGSVAQYQLNPTLPASPATAPRTHKVAPGDTLSKIARQYFPNDPSKVDAIFQLNKDRMPNKNTLPKIGEDLKLPPP